MEHLSAEIQAFLSKAPIFLRDAIINVDNKPHNSDSDLNNEEHSSIEDSGILPISCMILLLSSSLGEAICQEYGIVELVEQELLL